ncbi:uncharacterized protein LOC130747048 [Lotus japonicus]|uniref:uncharacterized protein LOC130747048 n=1 Tax=Lotus japonicus TaxID=34305 RepID=UPI0025868DB6|nr:uncharacterized protein LOC130747048 [Lotus japonicus]
MAIKVDDVSDVNNSKDTWNIVTKVVRLWVSPSFSGGKLPFSMELVLMDSKGCQIHASVRKTLVYRFHPLLTEDIIGILTGSSGEQEYEKDGKIQKRVTIELFQDGVRLECAFFGNYVGQILGQLAAGDMTNAVVVVQYAKIKPFRGGQVFRMCMVLLRFYLIQMFRRQNHSVQGFSN